VRRVISALLLTVSLLLISCEGDGTPQETHPATQEGGSGDYGSVIFPELAEH